MCSKRGKFCTTAKLTNSLRQLFPLVYGAAENREACEAPIQANEIAENDGKPMKASHLLRRGGEAEKMRKKEERTRPPPTPFHFERPFPQKSSTKDDGFSLFFTNVHLVPTLPDPRSARRPTWCTGSPRSSQLQKIHRF